MSEELEEVSVEDWKHLKSDYEDYAELCSSLVVCLGRETGIQSNWPMNVNEIMNYLPHRFPMLLVDRILELEPGKRAVGVKNVTINEAFFQGHYPQMPIMPGVLIVEAMAQAGALILLADPKYKGMVPVIGAIDDVKLRRQVVPGDQLISECNLLWFRNNVGRMKSEARVDGQTVASMELTFKLISEDA